MKLTVFQTAFPTIKSRWAKAQTVGLIFSLELRLSLFHQRSPGFLCVFRGSVTFRVSRRIMLKLDYQRIFLVTELSAFQSKVFGVNAQQSKGQYQRRNFWNFADCGNVWLLVIKPTSFASERDFRFKLPRKVTNHNTRIIKSSLRFCF